MPASTLIRNWFARLVIRLRRWMAAWALEWVPDLVRAGHFPAKIGRRLVVDTLVVWSEEAIDEGC